MIKHKILAKYFGTDKNYDEILCDNEFNENLRETLKECLKDNLPNCVNWPRPLFFHPAYSHCGCMTMSGYCCSFQEYKRTYYEETALLGGEARSLIVAGMVYAIFSVQKNRVKGTSDFLDNLELFLDNYNFFHHFKQLVKQTKSRYRFDFSIKSNLNDNLCRWDLNDFSDALQVSILGTFVKDRFYDFLNLPWRDNEDQLVALERIKEYYGEKYQGKNYEICYGDMMGNVPFDDSFFPLYEEAKRKIEKNLDIAFKNKKREDTKVIKEEFNRGENHKNVKSRSGRTPESLFKNTEGKKDIELTKKNASLFVKYLKQHKSSTIKIDAKKDNYVSKAFVVFYKKWKGMETPNGGAICRFLMEDCGLKFEVEVGTYMNRIRDMIKEVEKNSLLDIEMNVDNFLKLHNK